MCRQGMRGAPAVIEPKAVHECTGTLNEQQAMHCWASAPDQWNHLQTHAHTHVNTMMHTALSAGAQHGFYRVTSSGRCAASARV